MGFRALDLLTYVIGVAVPKYFYNTIWFICMGHKRVHYLKEKPATMLLSLLLYICNSSSPIQLGMLRALPMEVKICLKQRFCNDFVVMQPQLAPVFFTFSLGTKTHYCGNMIHFHRSQESTLLEGGTSYSDSISASVDMQFLIWECTSLWVARKHWIELYQIKRVVMSTFGSRC